MVTNNISELIAGLSPEKYALFAKRLLDQGAGLNSFPLSFAQERIWFIEQLDPGSSRYNAPFALRLKGQLDVRALEQALNEVTRRHEILRTIFPMINGEPMQVVIPPFAQVLPVTDLRAMTEQEREQAVLRITVEEGQKIFNLSEGPLVRTHLLRLKDEEHVVVRTEHHIISDASSQEIFMREVTALYTAYSNGKHSALPELPLQYADFAVWQRKWLQGEKVEQQLDYWKQQLGGELPVLNLPADKTRPAVPSFRGAIAEDIFPVRLATELEDLSRRSGVTLFITLLAVFQTLLHRYTAESDISVGTPILNRNRVELESVMGFFGNTLVMRSDLSGNPSFYELLKRVGEVARGAYAHQDVPFEQVARAAQPERSLSYASLIQVMFTLQNRVESTQNVAGLTWSSVNIDTGSARFDLMLSMRPMPGGMGVMLQYATDLFNAGTSRRMLVHLRNLLEGIVRHPERRLSEFSLLSESERQQILVQWNDTARDYTLNKTLPALFEEQVIRTPEARALSFGQQHLTYAELNARANQLAHHLRHLGVKSESCVGIMMERSIEMVVSLWAVLKAGGVYVPLDPAYPRERLSFMLEDSAVPILLTQQHLLEQLPAHHATVLCVDSSWSDIARQGIENLESVTTSDNLAYVIYTSGSTGRPKGAMISHRGITNRLIWMQEAYQLTGSETVLQKTPFSFDVSVWEFFWPMLVGARLVLAVPGGHQDSAYLVRVIREEEVTTLHFVPSMLQVFLETHGVEQCPSLRRVICSGEALSNELRQRFFARMGAQLHNLYGPTEASVDVTFWECQAEEMRTSVPIGRPVANTQIYILDNHLQPVPAGVPGELYIGGVQLGRGYLRRPELTAEKFVPDPFSTQPGERLYRTGDQARHLHDGEIEFIGRLDHQVKLRGFRIELGEIEAALAQHPSVCEVAVVLREDVPGDKRLVAYLVIRQGEVAPNNSQLRDFLQNKLPDHMVPAGFMFIDTLPLSPSGKLDRRALPALAGVRPELQSSFVAPRTHSEQVLAAIWSDVLRVERVGVHDDFFDLGGDSILSIQVVSRANQEGLRLRPRQIFQHHTVAQLAVVAATAPQAKAEQERIAGPVRLTPIQRWFFEQDFADPQHYNQALMLKVEERLDASLLAEIVAALLQQHDALRLRFIRNGEEWQQTDDEVDTTADVFVRVALRHLAAEEQREAIEEKATEFQRSLDLTQGPLIKIALLELGDEKASRLLIVIHHLVVDGVSWRILLEDLEKAYRQRSSGEQINLGPKTTSFKEWSQRLEQYQQSTAAEPEFDYWHTDARRHIKPLPTEIIGGLNTVEHEQSVSSSLDVEETHALLHEVGAAYHTQINDVLLTALLRTLSQWTGERRALIDLEGHGREDIVEGVDVSRTVGWFTTIFPVLLEQEGLWHPGETLKLVKEQLRAIPRRGIGYGLLRYLSEDESSKQQFRELPRSEVIFNYLGQLDGMLSATGGFSQAPESVGAMRSPRGKRTHLLDVSASIVGGRLQVAWSYSKGVFHQQTVERLAAEFNEALRGIIAHCLSTEPSWTPSDFPLAKLNDAQLQRVLHEEKDVEDIYALSPMQEGMLFQSLFEAGTGVYLTQVTCELSGELDTSAFEQSWQQVVNRHASLRTSFQWEGLDAPVQIVNRHVEIKVEQLDWREFELAEQQDMLEAYLKSVRHRGFTLNEAPLMKLTLFRTGDTLYRFVWHCHHLLVDGWSVPIIIRDVLAIYDGLLRGKQPSLGESRAYRDFIEWLSRQDVSSAEAYWLATLHGHKYPTAIQIGKTNNSETLSDDYGEQEILLTTEETTRLHAAAKRLHLTLNTLVQGAWALLLSRYSSEEDVIFGVTSSGRPASLPGVEGIVGDFINTLPARVRVQSGALVGAWLQELQAQQAEQRQYEYSTLAQVHGWSDIPRNVRMFDSILIYENYPAYSFEHEPGRQLEIRDIHAVGKTNYPLTVLAKGTSELLLKMWYASDRFDDGTISRMLGHFRQALQNLATDPDQRLDDVTFMSEAEIQQLVVEWNQTGTEYPVDCCIHLLFEQQAEQNPDAVAVAADEELISYAQLNRRANQLAHYLQSFGVGPEVAVGISLDRSPELIVGLLGILKAGGVYVPLDPSYPIERLTSILEDAQVPVILTQEKFLDALPATFAQMICIDADADAIACQSEENLLTTTSALNLAYIMYTSGSTGAPKGVGTTQRGVVRLVKDTGYVSLSAGEVFLHFAPLSFDASTFEIWGSLLNGARLALAPAQRAMSLAELAAVIGRQKVTTLWLTAGLFHQMVDEGMSELRGVRQLLAGGDVLSATHVRQALEQWPETRVINGYGPTETTTFACSEAMSHSAEVGERVLIGRPIANTKVYILDEQMRAAPVGVRGEIYIGGDGLARGYVGRAGQTAECFVPDPYSEVPGERLYATGDIGSYCEDGRIEFVGRRDGQVKVRGFRIETGEIEAVLRRHPDVDDCVVLVKQTDEGEKRLVAYCVCQHGDLCAEALRKYMKEKVPEYMLPSQFMIVATLPLTPNGKVEREALAVLETIEFERAAKFIPPGTPTEDLLATIWANVLHLEQVGRNDDFFELGGHSLLANQVMSRVRETFGVEVPLSALFEYPTLEHFASQIEDAMRGGQGVMTAPVEPVSREQDLPLSFAQQRLWFLNELEPGSFFYNIPVVLRLKGQLNLAVLEQTLSEIVRRHEVLRTTFVPAVDGAPSQRIAAPAPFKLTVNDISGLPRVEQEAEAIRLATAEAQGPFDLAHGPLLRISLLRLADEEHIALVTLHHIVSDGWSTGVFIREVAALYEAYSAGKESPLGEIGVQYADYAVWQREWLSGAVLEEQLGYWREQLGAELAVLDLPTDRPRPPVQGYRGMHQTLVLSSELSTNLKALCRREGVTLYMALLGAFQILLHRYTRQTDIVVGTPIAGRNRAEIEGLIGFFVNTLVMRTDLSGDPSFRDVLQRVRAVALGAYAHQDLPFEKLVEELQPERDLSRHPLFQVMFETQNEPDDLMRLPNLVMESVEVDDATAKFDLTMLVGDYEQGLSVRIEYSVDLFDAETIIRLGRHFETLLTGMVADPARAVADVPLLTDAEREQLNHWNDTTTQFPHELCFHQLFAAQVERTPDAVAAAFGDQRLTYLELDQRTNQLARYLQAQGVSVESRVGVYMDRGLDLLESVIAIFKAGGVYVPLDPGYPKDRLAFLLSDARVSLLLTGDRFAGNLPNHHLPLICVDADWNTKIAAESDDALVNAVQPTNLAYVIYTSGSTGVPKGAMIEHRGMVNHLLAKIQDLQLSETDIVAQTASQTFDISIWQLLVPLLAGGRVEIFSDEIAHHPLRLFASATREQVTILEIVPALLRGLLDEADARQVCPPESSRLRWLILTGDALPPQLCRQWMSLRPDVPLLNAYGPTECSDDVTHYAIYETLPPEVTLTPIGRAIANIRLYVADEKLRLLPAGMAGELYVGGIGVGRGYLNQPGLTAERFVPDPFVSEPGARLYKTGDLARFRFDGNIEFLGRLDHQVKVRGFRIELGEIESALRHHEAVREAVVMVSGPQIGEAHLAAYVVPEFERLPAADDLRDHLKRSLPEYMIPASFVMLEALPLTRNGKIDRRALAQLETPRIERVYVAPRTAVEEVVASIWAEVLKLEHVGVHDSFFDLGGHSLLSIQVLTRLHKTFHVDLPLRAIFEADTVAELSKRLVAMEAKPGQTEKIARIVQKIGSMSTEDKQRMLQQKRQQEVMYVES